MKYAFSMEKIRFILVCSLMLGVIVGTVFINCLNMEILNNLEIYGHYINEKLYNTHINRMDFFKYIFMYRIKEMAFVIILGLTSYRVLFHSLFLFYLGIKNSLLICMLTLIKGKSAILCYIVMTQPQMILYIIILYRIMKRMDFNMDKGYRNSGFKEILSCIIGIVAMCFLESMINITFLLKII